MRLTIKDLHNSGIPPAYAKQYFTQKGWDWKDFILNGREVTEDDLKDLPEKDKWNLDPI